MPISKARVFMLWAEQCPSPEQRIKSQPLWMTPGLLSLFAKCPSGVTVFW